jgi:hypothetical protein
MSFDLISTLIGFLVGTVTGAAGNYFANKFTDCRREQEAARQATKRFAAVRAQMPKLIEEMKTDLAGEGHAQIREFFVLPNKKVCLGGSKKPRFRYYEDEHDNLRGKLDILENADYLIDVTPGNTPIFRMAEAFVELLAQHG